MLLTHRRFYQHMPTTTGSIHMYWDDWLANPVAHQEALKLTSWLELLYQRLGLVTDLEILVLISSQEITYLWIELDTLVGLTRPYDKRVTNGERIHDTAVPTCSAVALSTWTPNFPKEIGALWLNLYSFHSIAI